MDTRGNGCECVRIEWWRTACLIHPVQFLHNGVGTFATITHGGSNPKERYVAHPFEDPRPRGSDTAPPVPALQALRPGHGEETHEPERGWRESDLARATSVYPRGPRSAAMPGGWREDHPPLASGVETSAKLRARGMPDRHPSRVRKQPVLASTPRCVTDRLGQGFIACFQRGQARTSAVRRINREDEQVPASFPGQHGHIGAWPPAPPGPEFLSTDSLAGLPRDPGALAGLVTHPMSLDIACRVRDRDATGKRAPSELAIVQSGL